ncbi:MAG TPA: hypothetical protein VFB62_07325, partial [Polyangiaceae bacterium]|nr:hypothetical protein [Polyangiaceae bacterium]
KIFEAVAVPALKAQLVALKAKKQLPVLPEQCRQDPRTSTVSFARTLWWAADILGIEPPVLYARTDVPGGIVAAPAQPLASIAGRDVLTRLGALDRAYVAGRHLAGYRAEHYVKAVFPTITELTVVFFAAIRLVRPELPAPREYAREVQLTTPLLAKHLTPPAREYLKLVVDAFVHAGARANIKRWAQAVDATAARTGFLLCGDLEVAWSMIAVEPRIVGDLRPEQRIRELLAYSVSEHYLELRRTLGILVSDAADVSVPDCRPPRPLAESMTITM